MTKVIVTTNAEKSAEVEVADCGPVKANGRIICNVNLGYMFLTYFLIINLLIKQKLVYF